MRSIKKFIGVILALSLLISTAAGCSKGSSKPDNSKEQQADTNSPVNPAGQMPIMKEKTTFRVMASTAPYIKDLATNDFTKYYEDLTNMHLDFEIVPSASRSEKVSVAFASGDYPDFFLFMGMADSTIFSYGSQGVVAPITKYVDKYAPNLKKIFSQYPVVKNIMTYPDGNIYKMSQIEDNLSNTYSYKMWVYRPWLQKLGLKEPTTTEEFYQMLKAFKEKDPNGNGKADEIPLVGAQDGPNNMIESFLMTPFIYDDGNKRFITKNGKLDVAFTQPEFKEGLKYINKLYKEGLIAPESFTQKREQRLQMGVSPEVTVGAAPANGYNSFVNVNMPDKRDANYFTIKPLKGPSGKAYSIYTPDRIVNSNGQLVITDKCKYPEAVVRWADALMTEEMTMRSVYGVEGVNWRKANPGEKGALGEQGVYVIVTNWSDIQNFAWKRQAPDFKTADLVNGEVYTSGFENNPFISAKQNYVGFEMPDDQRVDSLILSNEQTEEIADANKAINSYVNESIARFITGDMNIDTQWDTYLSELKKMGLDKYLQVYGATYDNMKKNASKK